MDMDETATTRANEESEPDAETRAALRYLFHPQLSQTYTRPTYSELPRRAAMKVGRVAAIYDRGRLLPHLARFIGGRGHDLGRFEKGCYIIVPEDFPLECAVHVTDQGVHAFAKVREEYRTFVVRPAGTAEAAWEAYEMQRGWARDFPEDIGRVYRPRRLTRLYEPPGEEVAALVSEYASAENTPGPTRALAVYRRPTADANDPLHLGAMLGFALAICAGGRRYTGIFLPEGAEEEIPALLELARSLAPDIRVGVTAWRNCLPAGVNREDYTYVGVMTEENAHDTDRAGHDYVTLVTQGGKEALLAGARTGSDFLFSVVVAAQGSFADGAEARDRLTRHFHGAHLALVWTDAPPPADAPAAGRRQAGALVTYDARHLPAAPETVNRPHEGNDRR